MDSIAKTSLLVAAMRAVESQRSEIEGRLFNDPFASDLAGTEGFELLKLAIAAAGDQPAIAIRTFFIDQKINEALNSGIRQIVILAAGMDSRAFRMNLPSSTQIFELDRQEVFDYKSQKLGKLNPNCQRTTISADLREDWTLPLLKAGFNKDKPTLWLVEGLLMYLDESQVLSLFQRLNILAKSKDLILFDILSRTLLEVPHMKSQLEFLKSIGAPWKFGHNDPKAFMNNLGWKAELSQAGDVAPSRWPFPTAPLSIPNIPRGYYVAAIKE